MKVKECKSYYGNCPCTYCEKMCCVKCGEIVDTEKLCKKARNYCEELHQESNEVGEPND